MQEITKRASWIELFYDVAYIALVAQLTYLATLHHHSLTDFIYLGVIGYTIFNAWWNTTANRNLQPSESASDKIYIQVQMAGAFLMSVSMASVFEGEYMLFFLSLAGVRLLQTLMLVRMYYLHPETRPVTYNIVTGFSVAAGLWVASAFAGPLYHLILIVAALLVDILSPLSVGKGNTKRYLNVYHLHERLGLFLMLVIGESMIVVALSSSSAISSLGNINIILSGLGLMAAIWWLYFDHADRHNDVRPKNLFLFLHSHGLLYGSIILVSVGYKMAIEGSGDTAAINFLTLGILGLATALLLIRSTLHAICVRSVGLIMLLTSVGAALLLWGVWFEKIQETAPAVTLFFIVVALLDYAQVFSAPKKNLQEK